MGWICGKCEKMCEQIELDCGGYEEWWGSKVWHTVMEDVSDCCHDTAWTLKDWISEEYDIPNDPDVQEAFYDEGIVQRGA